MTDNSSETKNAEQGGGYPEPPPASATWAADPQPIRSFQESLPNDTKTPTNVVPMHNRRITRAQAQEMRRIEAEGVPMWMDMTGFEATVRALSFADKTMLRGIDPALQQEITLGINARGGFKSGSGNVTFGDILRGVSNEERLINAVCCAGFIHPRLVLTRIEADAANDDDVWWVEELHIEDRRKYGGLVLGTDNEEAKRIASFLADRVSSSGDS